MHNNSIIENKIQETMNSIDQLYRAEPKPFFYTKLIAKLHNKKEDVWERWSAFIARPVSIIACICFVIFLNVMAIFYNGQSSLMQSSTNESSISDDYTQLATNLYDAENINPK